MAAEMPPIKSLVVDDENISRMKMKKILEKFSSCMDVKSGTEAFEICRKNLERKKHFDLITLDVSMPDMNGTEVLARIRDMEKTNKIPPEERSKILMITSHADKETVTACIQSGCDGYIIKPFSPKNIMDKLQQIGLTV